MPQRRSSVAGTRIQIREGEAEGNGIVVSSGWGEGKSGGSRVEGSRVDIDYINYTYTWQGGLAIRDTSKHMHTPFNDSAR